jgi:hypothetical protein
MDEPEMPAGSPAGGPMDEPGMPAGGPVGIPPDEPGMPAGGPAGIPPRMSGRTAGAMPCGSPPVLNPPRLCAGQGDGWLRRLRLYCTYQTQAPAPVITSHPPTAKTAGNTNDR